MEEQKLESLLLDLHLTKQTIKKYKLVEHLIECEIDSDALSCMQVEQLRKFFQIKGNMEIDVSGIEILSDEYERETSVCNLYETTWMSHSALETLEELLHLWHFDSLFPIFRDECIDVEAMRLMTQHQLQQLAKRWNLKMGIEIKFGHKLTSWQESELNSEPDNAQDLTIVDVKHVCPCDANAPDVKPSEGKMPTKVLDIENILKMSTQGRSILEIYKQNLSLNERFRTVIIDLVINYMVQNDVRMSVVLAKEIGESIVNLFQTEFLGYYYTKQPGKTPQGKIYDKYYNAVRQLKKNGILQKRPHSGRPQDSNRKRPFSLGKRPHSSRPQDSNQKRTFKLDPPETEIGDRIEAILKDNCSWEELENHWAATKNYRLSDVTNCRSSANILERWSQYRKPLGYKLIDMDFKHLYPEAESLTQNFDEFSKKIIPILEEKVKDQSRRYILQQMKDMENITENGRCCGIFFLIHNLLIPPVKLVKIENGKRIYKKYSIHESQSTFMISHNTIAECEEELLHKLKSKGPTKPLILVTGTVLEPKDIVVYFDGIRYCMDSAVHAIDICFKMFHILNLEYPKACSLVWNFIQKYFYKFHTNDQQDTPQICCLISKFENDI